MELFDLLFVGRMEMFQPQQRPRRGRTLGR